MTNIITIDVNSSKSHLGMACIICGESVKLTDNECLALRHGHKLDGKVCDKCKKAIMYMREQIEKE